MSDPREKEPKEKELTPFEVLRTAMDDPSFFVGSEPEGEDWSGWTGFDFRSVPGAWVIKEKYFTILKLDGGHTKVQIAETDPHDYHLCVSRDGRSENIGVSFVISTHLGPKGPILFIGRDSVGQEVIMRRKTDDLCLDYLPDFCKELPRKGSRPFVVEQETDQWAAFMKYVLSEKTVVPEFPEPDEDILREELLAEWGEHVSAEEEQRLREDSLTEQDILSALASATEQELLSYAYADFFVS